MQICGLYAGKPQPLGPRKALTAIVKVPVKQLTVSKNDTKEDQQANLKLHGGPEKVLHQFAISSYDVITNAFPALNGIAIPGSIGENLSVSGMNDQTVCIGDVYQIGSVTVEVSAPRAPCSKISQRFGIKSLDRFVGNQGITGWYYRIKQPGNIISGDSVSRVFRHSHTVSVGDLMQAVYNPQYYANAGSLIDLDVLDQEWHDKCVKAWQKYQASREC